MKLNGDHNQCPTCSDYFNSTLSFDKHRTGKHGPERRCLTEAQMLAIGMSKNKTGFWITEKMPLEHLGKR